MDDPMYEVARLIRPFLPALAGNQAVEIDQELADLLARASRGDQVSSDIGGVLSRSADMHAWAARVLADPRHLPPDLQAANEKSAFEPLPGAGDVVRAEKYACRYGDFVWYRLYLDDDPPQCPTHGAIYLSA